VAIALGELKAKVRIETLHGRDPNDRKKFTSRVREGKTAITHVEPLAALRHATLVRCRLETGRTHQIRMHLAEHGHAILGDPVYGRGSRDPIVRAAAEALGRQALHARVLGFTHPDGRTLRFEARPPEDFEAARAALSSQHS
jgi:23S rRNA pseudouridine1911/1915/1917 synthase